MLLGFSGQGFAQGPWGCEGSALGSRSPRMRCLTAQQQPFARVSWCPLLWRGLQAGSGASPGLPLLGRASVRVFS